jgi:hypothetical protein
MPQLTERPNRESKIGDLSASCEAHQREDFTGISRAADRIRKINERGDFAENFDARSECSTVGGPVDEVNGAKGLATKDVTNGQYCAMSVDAAAALQDVAPAAFPVGM